MEGITEEVVSQVAENHYIQGDITIRKEWKDISVEQISNWGNYDELRNQMESDYRALGVVRVYIDASTTTRKIDEEEYRMYEELFREKFGGEALLRVHYLDHNSFEKVEEILEKIASDNGGSKLEEIKEGQPYFGIIMRYGSEKFDDSLEIFKATKQDQEQKKYQ